MVQHERHPVSDTLPVSDGLLAKLKEQSFLGQPMMSKTQADEIGAVYKIDESDYVAKEVRHPSAGEELYTLQGYE